MEGLFSKRLAQALNEGKLKPSFPLQVRKRLAVLCKNYIQADREQQWVEQLEAKVYGLEDECALAMAGTEDLEERALTRPLKNSPRPPLHRERQRW